MTTHKHGYASGPRSPEYIAWERMRRVCNNPRATGYRHYGGRGIRVCERWNSFASFLSDVGVKPSPQHSLDRVNVDGPYAPGNVRWATTTQQNRNKTNNHKLTAFGLRLSLAEWSERTGIPMTTIRSRIVRSLWTAERAVSEGDRALEDLRRCAAEDDSKPGAT